MVNKVTIIIPAYNAEEFLAEAVESALAQTHADIEIIVVDDHSQDGTAALAARLAGQDRRISLIGSEESGGAGKARNRALAAASGNWIALLDADDILLPNHLELLLASAEVCKCDIVAGNQIVCRYEDGVELGLAFPDLTRARWLTFKDLVKSGMPDDGPSLSYGYLKPLFKREFLVRHHLRYDENYSVGEDFLFCFECLKAKAKVRLIADASYIYRRRGESITLSHNNYHTLSRLTADIIDNSQRMIPDEVIQLLEGRKKFQEQQHEYTETVSLLRRHRFLRGAGKVLAHPWIGARLAKKTLDKL